MRASSLALLLPCVALAGCASSAPAKKPAAASAPAPGWVKDPPQVNGRVYAIGMSGPTYWPQDALNHAQEDARGKLAIALGAQMEVLTKRAETEKDSTHLDLIKAATDMVVQNSQIEATWTDGKGELSDAGSVFALAFISLDKAHVLGKEQAVETSKEKGVPAWLERLPSQAGRIYAYGYSGPTFRTDDAQGYAQDDAVDNLAKALRSHVQAYQLLIENNTGLSVDEFSRTESPDDAFRDLIKKKSKIDTVWTDKKGAKAGYPAGSVWALAYVDVGSTSGGYQQVQNDDTGPALTNTGEAGAEPAPKPGDKPKGPDASKPNAGFAPEAKAPPKSEAVQEALARGAAAPKAVTAPNVQAATQAPTQATQAVTQATQAATQATQPAAQATQAVAHPAAPTPQGHPELPAGKLAPYPSEGEKCKPGYESTGGWCLPLEK